MLWASAQLLTILQARRGALDCWLCDACCGSGADPSGRKALLGLQTQLISADMSTLPTALLQRVAAAAPKAARATSRFVRACGCQVT